ncbi:MAG: DUF262 domain-containing HNH endonuclease family protein [Caulobacter sp.]|nr:DUF262 domain-containing HNH endonuclease family protein [Caulobacter sp.]
MSEAHNQIGFDQLGLGGILRQYQLIVPANQREYAWGEREVQNLFQDFAKAINDNDPSYFLGTIVTVPRALGALEVIDGQQRLATTAILLAAIRDHLKTTEPVIAEDIENGFLTGIDRTRRERIPKLRLNLDDNEFFRARILNSEAVGSTRASHERLAQAFTEARAHVRRIVSTVAAQDEGDVLNRWVTFIETGALAVLLRVPSDANAYKMFETLNDRGLKTSQADLVKNYLFGKADKRIHEAQQKWALMKGTLETLDDEDVTVTFLRHALIALRGYLRESEVYEAVQAQAKGEQQAITFLTSLESLSQNYTAIFNPEHEKWNGYADTTRRSIEVLNLLDIRPLRPLMLAVATKFAVREADVAYKRLVSWAVRLVIASSTRSGSVELPFAGAAHEVMTEAIGTAAELKARLAGNIPTDQKFQSAFEVATVSSTKLARYYLRSLEMAAKDEAEPWFIPNNDRNTINLEHVLPLKPEGNWPSYDEETHRLNVRRLGNLALLQAKNNSDLRSADFATKAAAFKDSPYVLTDQIASVSDWGPAQIAERQKILARLALKAWPL